MGTSIERGVFMKKIPAFNKEAFTEEKKKEFGELWEMDNVTYIELKEFVGQSINEAITKATEKAVLDYILSLGWQDTENEYVKEVLKDADRIASKLYQDELLK